MTILGLLIILVILALVAGVIKKVPILDPTITEVIKWVCIIAAVILVILLLLSFAGVSTGLRLK